MATNHRQPAIFTGCLQLRVIPAKRSRLLADPVISARDSPELCSHAATALFLFSKEVVVQRGCPREPRMPLALDATGGGCFAAPLNFPRRSDIAPYRHAVLRSLAHCVGCACLYRKKKKKNEMQQLRSKCTFRSAQSTRWLPRFPQSVKSSSSVEVNVAAPLYTLFKPVMQWSQRRSPQPR